MRINRNANILLTQSSKKGLNPVKNVTVIISQNLDTTYSKHIKLKILHTHTLGAA